MFSSRNYDFANNIERFLTNVNYQRGKISYTPSNSFGAMANEFKNAKQFKEAVIWSVSEKVEDAGVAVTEGGSAVRFSYNSWADTDKDELRDSLRNLGYSESEIDAWS